MAGNDNASRLLRCPRCKSQLKFLESSTDCPACKTAFPVRRLTIPLYDLYIDENTQESGRDPQFVWDLEGFERTYEKTGYHESGAGFDSQLGYPEKVSRFLFGRVKGRLLQWIQPGEGHTVLDVGCGAGYFLNLILGEYRKQGFSPTLAGMDISQNQLAYMLRRMEKEGLEPIAVHGNGEYLPFVDESFDLVTCSEVIEHIRNPVRALREMYRVLKPNGMLLLSTPSMTAQKTWGAILDPIAAPVKWLTRYKPDTSIVAETYYEVPWYAKEFKAAIREAQFCIDEFEYNAVIPHPWHFRFLPKQLVGPVVTMFTVVDRFFKPLVRPLALHFVVKANKRALNAQNTGRR